MIVESSPGTCEKFANKIKSCTAMHLEMTLFAVIVYGCNSINSPQYLNYE
jgi:hypothetical protein